MKDAEKNEINILLRNLAKSKRMESTSRDGREPGEGKHLDADELSSFAEGRLPAPTRSLYAAHLADCDRCRRIVSQLALAAGVGVVTTEAVAKRRPWTFLTAFFSPVVMRYAIPALAVVILAAAGLVWIKREPARESVAQQTQTGPASIALDTKPQTVADARTANSPAGEAAKHAEAKTATGSEAQRKDKSDDSTSARSNEKSKEEAKSIDSTTVAATPAPAKEAGAYAPPPPAKTEQEAAKDNPPSTGEGAKQRPQSEAAETAARSEDEERDRREKAAEGNKKAPARSAPAGRIFGGLTSQAGGGVGTRSVSGRHFRRVDNVWVDTAYSSSMSTTEVSRGSEQFRALIGDEPGLRTIAEQLDGEVIVVWKGKAYRLK